jgi:geranylgeranyl pyrophosphate synthase
VVTIFATTLAEICDGQIRETLDAHRITQSRADYDRRIYGKTAALFAGAAEMGALIGDASPHEISELRSFGKDLGMAFQVLDDILDLREGTDVLGKPAGNDLRQGVVTLPMMLFLENASETSREEIEAIIVGDQQDDAVIDQILLEIRQSGALEAAEGEAALYVDDARKRLAVVKSDETRSYLLDLLAVTTERAS